MVKTIISAYPKTKRNPKGRGAILHIAENFMDTIQGENMVGYPCTFLRLQFCTMKCIFCDSTEVWMKGNPYYVDELIELWEKKGVIDILKKGQHLVLTGGSPLKQQDALVILINTIELKYGFKPFVEVENECTIVPTNAFSHIVNRWNNSPKLCNSKMNKDIRYKPRILKMLSVRWDSWFKFVVTKENDWREIVKDFLEPGLIRKDQIVLMPEGVTREELQEKYEWLVKLCCRENVRMTDRLHITIWEKKTGV